MSTTQAAVEAITPHGGKLVNRVLEGAARDAALKAAESLPKLVVSNDTLQDAENFALGLYSPLEGFMERADLDSVVYKMRLTNGAAWTIPILLDVTAAQADGIHAPSDIALTDEAGTVYSILHVTEKYTYDPVVMSEHVFGTTDDKHPGVKRTLEHKGVYLAGPVDLVNRLPNPFAAHFITPVQMRAMMAERGWKTSVAFQTRNVPHGGHERMQKIGLSMLDGLLIQPVMGPKKPGDFKDEAIIKAYEAIIARRYPTQKVILAILPFAMRYAGPREAIFHAIVRKNFGCTHIVIGRDHAGVGKYYHPEAAIEIFKQFSDLEIQPLTIHGNFFYCPSCGELSSERTCEHDEKAEGSQSFSGTIIRNMLREGVTPRPEVFRPEVFDVLKQFDDPFVS